MHFASCNDCKPCKLGRRAHCSSPGYYYGQMADGGYASYVVCDEESLVTIPKSIPFEKACFLMCTAAVALRGLQYHAKIEPGDRVLITGATGGVGIHAIQVAKLLGAHVIALTSSQNKIPILKEYGADEVLLWDKKEYFDQKISGPVDVVLENVGAPCIPSSMRCLTNGGRLVIVGNVTMERFQVNPGYMILKEISLMGSRGASKEDVIQVMKWTEEGKLRPVIYRVMPLKEAKQAQEILESGQVFGRIVLVPSHSKQKL